MRIADVLVLGLIALAALPGPVLGENDRQYWSQYEVAWKTAEDIQIRVKPELRFRDDFSEHYYTHVEIGVDWSVSGWLVVAPYYRHITTKGDRGWMTEKQPHANATFLWKIGGMGISDRNRLEYRMKTDKESFRYRNRFWVRFPRVSPAGIQVFLGEEVFYDFDVDELNKNRAYAGFNIGLVSGLNADVYYILESSKKNGDWSRLDILATALKYKF